jgi:hypothetical protein
MHVRARKNTQVVRAVNCSTNLLVAENPANGKYRYNNENSRKRPKTLQVAILGCKQFRKSAASQVHTDTATLITCCILTMLFEVLKYCNKQKNNSVTMTLRCTVGATWHD